MQPSEHTEKRCLRAIDRDYGVAVVKLRRIESYRDALLRTLVARHGCAECPALADDRIAHVTALLKAGKAL